MANPTAALQAPEGLSSEDARKTIIDINQSSQSTNQNPNRNNVSQKPLPPITTATISSPHADRYIKTAALVSANATLDDALNIVFQVENPAAKISASDLPLPEAALIQAMYNQNFSRLSSKLAAGSIIVEAGDFATTACWTPASHTIPPLPPSLFDTLTAEGRPIFANFLRQIETAKRKHLFPLSERYWAMSLMARDPRREYVPGAVRAIVEPFLRQAEEEGVPVWLEAGSARARDVYGYFGFEVVDVLVSKGVETWCMIKKC